MNQPKISVIVLTYNQESTIGRALRSVAERCGEADYEIIIGDDCSTDSTRAECERFAAGNPHARLMPRSANKGIVRNYFDCLEAARGEYIADCAGDDVWLPDGAPIGEAAAILDADPGVSVVFSDAETMNESTGATAVQGNPFSSDRISGDEVMKRLLNHMNSLPYVLSAALFRRSALMEALERNRPTVCMPDMGIEDLPVIAALAAAGNAAYLPGRAMRYYIIDDSVSNSSDPAKQADFYARALECTRRLCESYGVDEREVREMFRSKSRYIVGMALLARSPRVLQRVERALKPWKLRLPAVARLKLALMRLMVLTGRWRRNQ